MNSCSGKGKQQSGQAEMRTQARSMLMSHWAKLALITNTSTKRFHRKTIDIAVTKEFHCTSAESLKEKPTLPSETFDTHI